MPRILMRNEEPLPIRLSYARHCYQDQGKDSRGIVSDASFLMALFRTHHEVLDAPHVVAPCIIGEGLESRESASNQQSFSGLSYQVAARFDND